MPSPMPALQDRLDRLTITAFRRLVERQSSAGKLSPAVERTIAQALDATRMTRKGKRRASPAVRSVVRAFNRLYYDDRRTWRANNWNGIRTWKCPPDLWLYQELIARIRPGLVIETGTAYGGSAMYLGMVCDAVGTGKIVSIDLAPKVPPAQLPKHPRVTYLTGSSTDPAIVAQALDMRVPGEPVLVVLDSSHREPHVRNELAAYADAVTVGSYLVVEDTNVNGHPVRPDYGPGPWEAVEWFLGTRDDFVVDRSMHRHHVTFNPRGYLRRIR